MLEDSFWALKLVSKSKIFLKIKINIVESCVIPILTYGTQTWTLTINGVMKLKTTQVESSR